MKKKTLVYCLIACLGLSFTACQDMLSPSSERHSYKVAQDTLYSYWGILRSMQNIAERYVVLGECRGELVAGTNYLSDSIQSILDFDMEKATDGSNRYLKAADYYHVINSCNAYLHSYDSLRTTGTLTPYMKKEAAQVSAIRAWTYLQLVQVYGKVPFYTHPLLTSDEINNFMRQPEMVTVDDLADKLVAELESAAQVEAQYGFPQYQNYGFTSTVAHSSKLMIPMNIILGDLFLAKGDAASCARAAQYYFNYLSGNNGMSIIPAGGPIPSAYKYVGVRGDGATETSYRNLGGTPWTENDKPEIEKESITAIASSTNKLWGNVLRGVNELYGYEAEISVRTDESQVDSTVSTNASVTLNPMYNVKQLTGSQAYLDLCSEQSFEQYIGTGEQETWLPMVDENVGDARQYWLTKVPQSYSNGTSGLETFITKQNPDGVFTTVFPMIYRKGQIWLRFAEAICNAGYPSYAFAVLKDGFCDASYWLPIADTEDYEVEVWQYSFTDTLGVEHTSEVSKDALANDLIAQMTFETEEGKADTLALLLAAIDSTALEYGNCPSETSSKVVNYIAHYEARNLTPYLNFDLAAFNSKYTTRSVFKKESRASNGYSSTNEKKTYEEGAINGIHTRGCGTLTFEDRAKSAYTYVGMVTKKAKENYGVTLTREDIYDEANKELVQKCVEDLIVDEAALELAFEGCRFFDLMRVAHRRGDASYLANKLAKRNPALQAKLSTEASWYFPLPQY